MKAPALRTSALALGFVAAAALAVPAGVDLANRAQARATQPGPDARRDRVTPEIRSRLLEGRLAMIKTTLGIKPGDQERHWAGVEKVLRDAFAARQRLLAERREPQNLDAVGRLERRAQRMEQAAAQMKQLAMASKPLYDSLDANQKTVADTLLESGFRGRMRGMPGRDGDRRGGPEAPGRQ